MRTGTIVRERASSSLGSFRPGLALPKEAAPRKPRRRAHSAIAWAGLGFVTGAIFWHVVGFWTFLSNVVLKGATDPVAKTVLAGAAPSPTATSSTKRKLPTIYLVDAAKCTALALDRRSNRTSLAPCPENGLALRLEPEGDREDLAIATAQPSIQAAGYRAD